MPPVSHAQPLVGPRILQMPELNGNIRAAARYLTGRGIHPNVIGCCAKKGLLFETKKYHNALFAGYDTGGTIRYAALRGTMGDFKGEVHGSDKRYSFCIAQDREAETVHLFESAIDLMSYATLCIEARADWQRCALLSLGGVSKEAKALPPALEHFLQVQPQIRTLQLHLDNDDTGRGAAAKIAEALRDKYTVSDRPPRYGKDVNELLQIQHSRVKKERSFQR